MSSKVNELQLLQQNLQQVQQQKQQIEGELTELNSACTELKSTDKAYKIVGKIMIAASKDDLSKDLEERRERMEVRLGSFVKQDAALRENIEKVQKDVVKELKK